jgi:predicted DNA-binding protein (UPF0251 family)
LQLNLGKNQSVIPMDLRTNGWDVNPCRGKGDPRGRQFSVGKNGKYVVSPCECKRVRVSIAPEEDGRYLRYGLSTGPGNPGETIRLKNPRRLPEDTIRTVPCYEVFRHLYSPGTRAYRKLEGGKTFLGCGRLEEDLLEEQLVRHLPAEREELGWHLIEGTTKEPLFSLPSPDESIEMYAALAAFAIEATIDPEKKPVAGQIAMSSHSSYSPAISDLIRLPPVDIYHAHVRRLYSSGAFDGRLKLKIAGFLLCRNIRNKAVIENIFPLYEFSEFKEAKREIDRIVARTLPDRLKRLKRYWKTLTPKQRIALKLKYDEELTYEEGARRLQISVDSFRDRIILAEKKLESAFPELKRAVEPSTKTAKAIAPVRHFSKKTNCTQLVQIVDRRITPWGPPKKRKDVNKPEVYRWLDKVCPIV